MVLLASLSVSARHITPDEAMSAASDFLSTSELRSASASSDLRPMKAPGVGVDAVESPYYIFNRGANDGFVIISGDDRAPKILGYSDKGSFDANNLPPQLKAMMEQWATQMSQLSESNSQHASWSKTVGTRAGEGILMETAEWGQGYPYNALCPVIDGEQAPAGCVATAMAIAMKYHNWPDYTRGGKQDDFNYPEFTFDFDDYTIDWNVLEDKTNPKFASEVSKLMYTTGVTAQMMYGPYESSAEMWPLGHKMVELFTYSKGCQYIDRCKFSDDEWYNMLVEQLQKVGPIIYSGSGSIGHAFVIDGYDGDSLFHVNWGWDGLLNGYYTLDFSDVGGSNFSEYQGMIINIKPDKERRDYSKTFIPNSDVYMAGAFGCEGWNFWKPDIVPGELTEFRIPTFSFNGHIGYYNIAIVDDDDNILEVLDMSYNNNDPNRHCPYPGTDPIVTATFPVLQKGQRYQFVSMEADLGPDGMFTIPPSKDPKDWKIVLGGIVYPSYFYDKGNRSIISEINFHVDEKVPILFTKNNTWEREFKVYRLKGGDGPDNILKPIKGVSMNITCTDKNGNPEEPIYVGTTDEEYISLNISMYSDKYDVYIDYEYDGNTRKDQDIPSGSVIEQDGLIYRILKDGVSLIGYDKISDSVIIPDFIKVGEKELNVVSIDNDALLFAPIKNLTIKASKLESIGSCSFAGIDKIESLSFEDAIPVVPWSFPFLMTHIDNVYMNNVWQNRLIPKFMNFSLQWTNESAIIYSDDIDFYLSDLGDPNDVSHYIEFIQIYSLDLVINESWLHKIMNSYNIPGLGNVPILPYINSYELPIRQMWIYEIDKDNGLVSIKDPLENVTIDNVIINGAIVEKNEDGLYTVPAIINNDLDVVVEYTINGEKKMRTQYTPYYNSFVENTRLKPFVMGDSNDDGIINIADAVNAANYIVGLDTTDFNFECADVNADGDITVSDVTSIISLIPAQTYVKQVDYSRSLAKAVRSGYLVSSVSDTNQSVEFSVVSDEDITALQFDEILRAGDSMPLFKLSDAFASTHMLQQFNIDSNTVRVVVYSASGKLLTNSGNNPVMTLSGAASPEDIVINNIFASDARGASHGFEFEDLGVSNAVSESLVAAPEVKVDGNMLVVSHATGNTVSVYALDGRCIGAYSVDTDRFEVNLSTGMYIVTVDKSSHRVIIK